MLKSVWKGRPAAPPAVPGPSVQNISDAYLYLLGRLFVLRQEHVDFGHAGVAWNHIVHRVAGVATGANPDLDCATSHAWIAVDDNSCTLVDVPPIDGRYFTIQALNPWGETIANVNERTYPDHHSGTFAFCLTNAEVQVPRGAYRIDVPGRRVRVVVRVELGPDPAVATALQHRVAMHATGTPRVEPPVRIRPFSHDRLPRVEAFDMAAAVLNSEPDVNPATRSMHALVRAVAAAAARTPGERHRIDSVIRVKAWEALRQEVAALAMEANGWVRPRLAGNYGSNWLGRTAANLVGLWSNNQSEVISFTAGTSSCLRGCDAHTIRFDRDDPPGSHVRYFWSVTCLDAVDLRVLPNPANRFALNSRSDLRYADDGSLTLYLGPERPADAPGSNWLPTPADKHYVLVWRSYGPDEATQSAKWFPPPLRPL